jgi:eukaryotic-like serine/threonine-protein kinase
VSQSNAIAAARIGSTVAGKYRLNRLIGVGGIGAVYAALHQFTGRHVALKLIDPRVAAHDGYATRFLREARAAAEIGHPAICDVLDAGQEPDGSLYIALELLEGRTLDHAIEATDLRWNEIVEVGIQLLDGLAAAHDRGIVHRDIKPDNVFLTWDEQGELHVKLLDFGVAKNTKGGPEVFITQQGAILGTPYYMSPEQAAGELVDARADIWSVGAVLFHALSGRPPFDEATYNRLIAKLLNQDPPRLREVRPDLPEWLTGAVDGALQRDVEARWQSVRTMSGALARRDAPIELDWEVHEDATVRTASVYDSGEDESPTGGGIEVDVELTGGHRAVSEPAVSQRAIRTDRPPPPARSSIEPEASRASLWYGVALGAVVTAVVALSAAFILYRLFIAPAMS